MKTEVSPAERWHVIEADRQTTTEGPSPLGYDCRRSNAVWAPREVWLHATTLVGCTAYLQRAKGRPRVARPEDRGRVRYRGQEDTHESFHIFSSALFLQLEE